MSTVKIKVRSKVLKATERMVGSLEHLIGQKLPSDYVNFLMETNGGRPTPDGFLRVTKSGKVKKNWVDEFLHVGSGPSSLEDFFTRNRNDKALPEGFIQVGVDAFDDRICINLNGEGMGAISFCPHDLGLLELDSNGVPLPSSTTLLAPSFQEFLSKLHKVVDT